MKRFHRLDIQVYGIWVLLALGFILAAITLPEFRDPANLANVLRQASVLAILAIGQTFVVAAGMVDLSVGMIAGLVVVLSSWMLNGDATLTVPVVLAVLALGIGIGAVNGALVNWLRLNSLIATFGMLFVLQGMIFAFTDRSVGLASAPLRTIANGDIWGVPISALVVLALMAVAGFVFARSRFGYHLLATGGDAASARRSGIRIARVRLTCFMISGGCAALAGLVLAGRLGTGYPLAGAGLELDSIVAVVLGGTALAGGRGSVVRSVGGAVALSLLSNVLNLMEVSAYVQMFLKGVVVVLAIVANQPREGRA